MATVLYVYLTVGLVHAVVFAGLVWFGHMPRSGSPVVFLGTVVMWPVFWLFLARRVRGGV